MRNALMLGAMGLAVAAGGSPSGAMPSEEKPTLPEGRWPHWRKNVIQVQNPKQKPCGRKRIRKPRVTSPASHHHARYVKRKKRRYERKELAWRQERARFKAAYIAHMKERLK